MWPFKNAQDNGAVERSYPSGSIAVNDPEMRKRLQFLQITEVDLGVIRCWEPICKAAADAMIDAFMDIFSRRQIRRPF